MAADGFSCDEVGCGVMDGGSLRPEVRSPASLPGRLSPAPDGPDPAGVKGGEAKAEILGLPWGDCIWEEIGVDSLVESGDSSSREGTCRMKRQRFSSGRNKLCDSVSGSARERKLN